MISPLTDGRRASLLKEYFEPKLVASLGVLLIAQSCMLLAFGIRLISVQALIPYALDKWFGLNGNWFLLFGGVVLIFTLLQNPSGVAGDLHRRLHKRPQPAAPT